MNIPLNTNEMDKEINGFLYQDLHILPCLEHHEEHRFRVRKTWI